MFYKIAVIGTGNVGTWLFNTLQNQNNISVVSVSGRKMETLHCDCDLYIFALKDDVYADVLQQISFKMTYAVHTSGSLSQHILAPFADNFGVFYPYQTISRYEVGEMQKAEGRKQKKFPSNFEGVNGESGRGSLYQNIPICIEGSNQTFEYYLFQWAKSYFSKVYKISEKQRFAMHLAAVFASNFTNAMYGIAFNIFKENDLDWNLIMPLLENTLQKAKHTDPYLCQTGPAKRNDISIMEKHCNALKDEELKNLYRIISQVISNLRSSV